MGLRVLDEWLADGDAGDGDWAGLIVQLANRDELGRARRLLLDLPALAQPFECRTSECTPGQRAPRTRSCCADIEVSLSPRERRALERARGRIAAFMKTRDPRWAGAAPAMFGGDDGGATLARSHGRCIFAVPGKDGLRCGLHQLEDLEGTPRGRWKPIPCRLFPLVVVDLGGGQRLLTALRGRTSALVGTFPPRRFPCLRDDPTRPPLYRDAKPTLQALFGDRAYREIASEIRAWQRRKGRG